MLGDLLRHQPPQFASGRAFLCVSGCLEPIQQILWEQFSALYDEGADEPKMMTIGLHCRLAGHPFRSAALSGFLESIAKKPGVWLCRRSDIARHWIARFPAAKIVS